MGGGAWQIAAAGTVAVVKLWASSEKQVDRQLVLTRWLAGTEGQGGTGRGLANGDSLSVDSVTVNCMQKLPLDGVRRCAAQN